MILSVHATVVSVAGHGVLLRGPSGSGKSSLALQLIDQGGLGIGKTLMAAKLVADDQVILVVEQHQIIATAPPALLGKLEIRGWGIVIVEAEAFVKLDLVVDLISFGDIPRLPEPSGLSIELLGIRLKRLRVDGADPAAVAKIRAALC